MAKLLKTSLIEALTKQHPEPECVSTHYTHYTTRI